MQDERHAQHTTNVQSMTSIISHLPFVGHGLPFDSAEDHKTLAQKCHNGYRSVGRPDSAVH